MPDGGSPQRPFFAALHGLRGVMALWVVSFHVSPSPIGPVKVAAYGYLAVDVFFLLSGFVLIHAHGAEFRRLGWPAARRFLLLRWWRTYPLYAVSLVLSVAAYVALRSALPGAWDFLASAALLERWAVPGMNMNGPAWSLGVEWLGYLAFPAVAWLCMRLPARLALPLAGAAALGEVAALLALSGKLDMAIGPPAVARMAGGFLAGCILARRALPAARPGRGHDAALALVVVLAAGTLLLVPDVWCLPLLVTSVALAAQPGPATAALLSAPLPMYLGRISFALYLCHWPILKMVQAWQPTDMRGAGPAGTVLTLAASLAMAHVLCRTVEEPLRRYGARWVNRLAPGGLAAGGGAQGAGMPGGGRAPGTARTGG